MALFATTVSLLLFLAVSVFANPLEDYEDFQDFMRILSKPRMLDRDKYSTQILKESGYVHAIKWKNCGASTDPLRIVSLTLTPNPVVVPGKITVSFKASVKTMFQAPISLELTLKKKLLVWIEIPCISGFGSCSYKDMCALISNKKCPPQFIKAKIPCHCPVKQGTYMLPMTPFPIPSNHMPSWLRNGDYRITAKLKSHGQSLGCFFIQLSVKG